MFDVIIEYATLHATKMYNCFEFTFKMSLEDNFHIFKNIYESRPLKFDNKTKLIPIHERFTIDTEKNALFLKCKIKTTENKIEKHTTPVFFLFYKTCNSLNKINFNLEDDVQLEISFKIVGSQNNSECLSDTDLDKNNDESPSFIELIKITKIFMKKVTAVRKLQWWAEKIIVKKNYKRDFWFFIALLFFIYFGRIILITIVFLLFFQRFRNKYRSFFLESMGIFFKKEEASIEMNNNLKWIKDSQLMVINLSHAMKNLSIYSENKFLLFLVFKNSIYFFSFLIILFSFSLTQLIIISYILFYLFKYFGDLQFTNKSVHIFIPNCHFLTKNLEKQIKNLIKKLKPRKNVKFLFFQENESKNFGKFDKSALPILCKLKSHARIFGFNGKFAT